MDKRLVLIPLILVLAACAATPGGGPRRSARVLLAEEIAEAGVVTTAAEAIRQLRPQWLNTRSTPTMTNPDGSPPVVYVDGLRADGIRELERIRATQVERMQYLSPSDATNRFGTDHIGGAILITTR